VIGTLGHAAVGTAIGASIGVGGIIGSIFRPRIDGITHSILEKGIQVEQKIGRFPRRRFEINGKIHF
jgi:hypothetical protein